MRYWVMLGGSIGVAIGLMLLLQAHALAVATQSPGSFVSWMTGALALIPGIYCLVCSATLKDE